MKYFLILAVFSYIFSSALCDNDLPTRVIPGATLLLVAGGLDADGDVEILDMTTDLPLPCFKPVDLPEALYDHVGAFFAHFPTFCGGRSDVGDGTIVDQKYCFQYKHYDTEENGFTILDRWDVMAERLDLARVAAASTMMRDGEWWITGGENGLDTTERIVELQSTGSRIEPPMPAPNSFHSAAAATENEVLFLNGDTNEVWMYSRADSESEESTGEYDLLDSQSEVSRVGGYAGIIRRDGGTIEIVVAGGVGSFTSTQIFSYSDMTWRDGPDFPYQDHAYGALVQLEDTFMIVGGESEGETLNRIVWFDTSTDEWDLAPQVMLTPRSHFAAVMTPVDFVQCP